METIYYEKCSSQFYHDFEKVNVKDLKVCLDDVDISVQTLIEMQLSLVTSYQTSSVHMFSKRVTNLFKVISKTLI